MSWLKEPLILNITILGDPEAVSGGGKNVPFSCILFAECDVFLYPVLWDDVLRCNCGRNWIRIHRILRNLQNSGKKVHMKRAAGVLPPLRSIVSSIGAYNYNLASILGPCIPGKHTTQNTFSFVNEFTNIQSQNKFLLSRLTLKAFSLTSLLVRQSTSP